MMFGFRTGFLDHELFVGVQTNKDTELEVWNRCKSSQEIGSHESGAFTGSQNQLGWKIFETIQSNL